MGEEPCMKLGPFFRQHRLDAGMTIHQVADNIVSDGVLSRFERGESEVSALTFWRITKRLNQDMDTLQHQFCHLNPQNDVVLAAGQASQSELVAMMRRYRARFVKTGWRYDDLAATYCQALAWINHSVPELPETAALDRAMAYLEQIKRWGSFETALTTALVPCLKQLQLDRVAAALTTQLTRDAVPLVSFGRDSVLAQLLAVAQTVAEVWIESQQYEEAANLLHLVARFPLDSSMALQYRQQTLQLRIAYHRDHRSEYTQQFSILANTWQDTQYQMVCMADQESWHRLVRREEGRHDD